MEHKYQETRAIHFYICGNCKKEFEIVDGDPACFEELGPQFHEIECPHCKTELDASPEDE